MTTTISDRSHSGKSGRQWGLPLFCVVVLTGVLYFIYIAAAAVWDHNKQTAQQRLEQLIQEQEELMGPQHCRNVDAVWACLTNSKGKGITEGSD